MTEPAPAPAPRKDSKMKELQPFLVVAGVIAAWFVLNKWVLPKFGVQT